MEKIKILRQISFLILLSIIFFSEASAQEKALYKDLNDAILSARYLRGNSGPRNVNWIDGGNKYSYIARNDSTRKNEIRSLDPKTLNDVLIFNGEGLTFPGTDKPFNYNSFQWAQDSKHLLFRTNFKRIFRRSGISDYYIYSLENRNLKLAAEKARTAELSPDGSLVGIERDGNLFVYSFADKKEKQLTFDTDTSVFNGHYDWVYEEEFGQAQAWNWSPDNKHIAYWHFNVGEVPLLHITNYEGIHPYWEKLHIPLVADPNPKVKIGVLDVNTGKNIWLDPGLNYEYYVPRLYWTSKPNTLAMMTLNRAQTDMKLFFFDVTTGEHKLVLEQKDKAWIDVFDFFGGVNDMIYFPEKIDQFFWISDKDGYQHIYRYDYSGKLLNKVTSGNYTVTRVEGINTGTNTIYYSSTEVSPLERQLYSIKFDGSDKEPMTTASGRHSINMSPNTKYYIDSYSNKNLPRQVDLKSTDGTVFAKLETNEQVKEYIKKHFYSPVELSSFTTSDGVKIDFSMIKPMNFDEDKKYPVVFTIYGGPGSQAVYNRFETGSFGQYMAQKGYIVVDVNNRGTGNYGKDFMKVVYKHLGKWESNDFAETAKYLSTLSYVDSTKIAIMGTSYGGYSTAFTLVTHPGVFKVGIANSPVTTWRLYDDIYTERYMGLLQDNENGYKESSCMTHASNLEDHLMLIHSDMDENVRVQNTMQLLTALSSAGKDVDLRIYPPGGHGAAYNFPSYILINQVYYNYLDKYLNGGQDQIPINKK